MQSRTARVPPGDLPPLYAAWVDEILQAGSGCTYVPEPPWYPTMRLFRQTEPGNWRVFERMAEELKAWAQPSVRAHRP